MRLPVFIVLMALVMATAARADSTITYQGQLQQGGSPHDGKVPMAFHLFEEGAQQPLATIEMQDVVVKDGHFQVDLDFGDGIFTGQPLFLEVIVEGQALTPLQPIRPVPVALFALAGNEGPEGPQGPEGASPFELIGDAIEYVADGQRIGFYPDGEGSSSFIAGHENNQATGLGATVAGGGLEHVPNLGKGNFSTIGGGFDNRSFGFVSTIGGGASNVTGDDGDPAIGLVTTIAGGFFNVADGDYSTIGGGIGNHASGEVAVIGGGEENQAIGDYSFIGGGGILDDSSTNIAYSNYGVISGGYANTAGSTITGIRGSVIGGGGQNSSTSNYSTIGGGRNNAAYAASSTIGGGTGNTAEGSGSTISGGGNNLASGSYTTVGGGLSNTASEGDSFVGGGNGNTASGFGSTVCGGANNTASGDGSSVVGGSGNTASGFGSTAGGGFTNCAGADGSWASGLRAKVRPASDPGSGSCSNLPSYPGGSGDQGTFVWADSTNEDFVSSGQDQFLVRAAGGVGMNTNAPQLDFHILQTTSDGVSNGLMLERSNGSSNWSFYVANSDNFGIRFNGSLIARIDKDTGDWEPQSDRRRKHSIQPISGVLEGVLQLSPSTFQFNGSNDADARHLGYIAQDVARVFPEAVTQTDDELMTIRPTALTALNTAALIEMNGRYEQRIGELEQRLEKLEALLIEKAAASTATP